MDFMAQAQAYDAPMRAFFEDLHRHPEPSHHEVRTNRRIREALAREGIELLCPAQNITIAVIRGAHPGKTVGLRFDTDCLQMQELTDLPYKSETDGLMHGCGHDAHAAVGVFVSHLLADNSGILSFRSQLLNPGCNFLAGISLLKRNHHLQPAPGLVYLVLQGINLL